MDLAAFDTLADDLRKHRLQLTDQVGHIFLMNKGMLLRAGQGDRLLLFLAQKFRRGASACLKDHCHAGERGDLRLPRQRLGRFQRLLIIPFDQRVQNGVLGGKIIIDASFSHSRRLRDLADRYALNASAFHQILERIQNLLVFGVISHMHSFLKLS